MIVFSFIMISVDSEYPLQMIK